MTAIVEAAAQQLQLFYDNLMRTGKDRLVIHYIDMLEKSYENAPIIDS